MARRTAPSGPATAHVPHPGGQEDSTPSGPGLHGPSLALGVGLMLLLTVYPPLLTDAQGKADHTLASLMLFAMCAALVRGVGFVPRWWGVRWLLSGTAASVSLALATAYRLGLLT